MNEREISLLLKKADELRALFVLGQRVIPFLEEIFLFVSEIEPILHEINTSIKDNLKKMPKASKQLSKVTEATEFATTEILDILDGLAYKNEIISSNLLKIKSLSSIQDNKSTEMLKILLKGAEKGMVINDFKDEINDLINLYENNLDNKVNALIDNTNDINNSIVNDSSSIAMSLQVQDITSQQIAAVNNLLETVQARLSVIMEKFKKSDIEEFIKEDNYNSKPQVAEMHRKIAFDPDAVDSYDLSLKRQDKIDELINSVNNGENILDDFDENKTINQSIAENTNEDIESNSVGINHETPDKNKTTIKIEDEILEEVPEETVVDINELGDLDDEISQDDIDALFGKI